MTLGPIVSTQWLEEHLQAADLVVFDATTYLPNENQDADAHFQKTHIPGARRFDLEIFSDTQSPLPNSVPAAGQFAALIGKEGVGPDSRVVVYDQKGLFSAARARWLLRYFGHEQVAVLDGGLPKWTREARPVEQGHSLPRQEVTFPSTLHARHLVGLGDLLQALTEPSVKVLDARAAARFSGTTPEPRPGIEAGHIPGSHNLPYTQLLNPDHTLKSPEQLRALLSEAGVAPSSEVIATCGSGVTATIILLALELAGFAQGKLYDGSWSEWGSRADTPQGTWVDLRVFCSGNEACGYGLVTLSAHHKKSEIEAAGLMD